MARMNLASAVVALAALIMVLAPATAAGTTTFAARVPGTAPAPPPNTFRAAAAQLSFTGGSNLTARENQEAALAKLVPFIASASAQGANIFNEPEDFLYWNSETRATALAFCETIPNIDAGGPTVNPCTDNSFNYSTHLVLKTVSCAAAKYGIHVVINTAEVEWCTAGSVKSDGEVCPQDGRFQYNTDVAFSDKGDILAKYRKSHLTAGSEVAAFNEPPPKAVYFDTPFGGRFGMMTCYDIEFKEPASLLLAAGVTNILYEVDWVTSPPLISGVMVQQARSRMLGVNLIAANNNGLADVAGGGIYSAGEPVDTWFAPYTHSQDKLLVADVPILTAPRPYVAPEDAVSTPTPVHPAGLPTSSSLGHTTCSVGPLAASCFGFSADPGTGGTATVVQPNALNCTVSWAVSEDSPTSAPRDYAIVAVSAQITYGVPDPLFAQICAVFQCTDFPSCPIVWNSTATFSHVELSSNITSTIALPMLGVGDAQVLDNSAMSVSYQPQTSIHVATTAAYEAQSKPLYSLSVFGFSGKASSATHVGA